QQVTEKGVSVEGEEWLRPPHAGGLSRRQDDGGHVRTHGPNVPWGVASVRALALVPTRLGVSEQGLRRGAIGFLVLAACFGTAGGTWDAAWHVTLRRESFWTPPHLL